MKIFYLAAFLCIILSFAGCGKKPLPEKNIQPIIEKQVFEKDYTHKIRWVAIAPYDSIDSATTELISTQLEDFYGVRTLLLPKAFMTDSLLAWSKTRYNANKILAHLTKIKPDNVAYILALTSEKIAACGDSIHETGVAGLGNRPGTCSVVSTATLHRKVKDEEQYTQRLIKACMHEMGHNFGLRHCKSKDKKCFMRDAAGTILTLDEEEIYLCKKCMKLLNEAGFNLKGKT